ncbi:MAG: methylated-DNA--[protein]-cysteine S-methyltransferase [Parvibaculaceae bacterium]|nr:methylated-DNA--[protein]-cysteine S-methyltransferase [Parvibaculaceae bacterium]
MTDQATSTSREDPEALLWDAIENRRTTLDGILYFGVVTTGIYCRPSCPARRPKRENVRFFSSPHACREAGLRACKRCHPDEIASEQRHLLHLCQLLENTDPIPSLASLARTTGLSKSHVQKLFKAKLGVSPKQYGEALRHNRFRDAIKQGADITNAIYEAGYGAPSRFYEKGKKRLGMSPAAYRKGAPDMDIVWTIRPSALGNLLVAATHKGLSFVAMGETARMLEEMHADFPNAQVTELPPSTTHPVEGFAATLVNYLEGKEEWKPLPTDVQCTAFQAKVYAALCDIPAGQTLTYSQLAEKIGAPKSVRAAASACARNTVSLSVPCHRILPKAGGVGGYRWGPDRKVKLLEMESKLGDDTEH